MAGTRKEAKEMLETVWIQAADKESRRLMVVLHGLGDSEAGYRWLPDALQLDWMNYLLVNAPDPYYGGFSWYDIYGEAEPGVRRSRTLLVELLDEQRRRGFPTCQTTLFGFSQGCLMAWEMGLRYPHRFAGVVGISGYVHEPEKTRPEWSSAAQQQRFLITHGTYDPLIPFPGVRKQIQWLQTTGLHIEWQEFKKEHTIAGEQELDVIRSFIVKGYEPVRPNPPSH